MLSRRKSTYFRNTLAMATIAMWCIIAIACSAGQVAIEPKLPVNGIDISSHNGKIDFEAVRADSIDFVIIKATEGSTFKDPSFQANHSNAAKAGLKVGAYHFFRFETNGQMQALNFIKAVRGRHLDLPLIIDIEEWGNPETCPTSEIMGRLNEMIEYLESQGYPVMIYTNLDGYERFVENRLERIPLWLCSFSNPPLPKKSDRVTLWQYSHTGSVNGINGDVDRNAFMGSRADYVKWLNTLTFPPQYYD